jgi:hypothetical protein
MFDDFTLSGTQSAPFTNLLNARLASRDGELAQAQQQLATRDAELAQAQQQLATRDAELAQTQQQLAARDAELAQAQEKLVARNLELLQVQQELAAATERIGALLSSRSWRLTKPLRVISRWCAKGLK